MSAETNSPSATAIQESQNDQEQNGADGGGDNGSNKLPDLLGKG
jgi:hypothetical protein